MPEDATRVTYDENGGKVTAIPKGTPKQEMAKAKEAQKPQVKADNSAEVVKEPRVTRGSYGNKKMGAVK